MKPGSAVKNTKLKPVRKKRRIFLWFFLTLVFLGGLVGAGFYYRLVPLDPDTALKVEPYILKAEEMAQGTGDYLAKLKVWEKKDEMIVAGKPKTNFPLVELEDNKTVATLPTVSSSVLRSPSVASASPAQPSAGAAAKPLTTVKESTETSKIYGKLSKLYGSMKPEEAAAVLNNLEDEQVVMILARMDEESAGRVLASLEPRRAARLTQAMIKRK